MEQNREHRYHKLTLGQWAADKVAALIGSWKFIFLQTALLAGWIVLNAYGILTWDSHPFIFLALLLGIQAAYAAPVILMSQNRSAQRDRRKAEADLATDRKAEREIEQVQAKLEQIEKKINDILSQKRSS